MKKDLLVLVNKLYENIEYSNTPTEFYNRVYKYIKFLESDKTFSKIKKHDSRALSKHDKENIKNLYPQDESEDDLDFFVRKMRHISSGEGRFLNIYYYKIYSNIYYPLFLYKTKSQVSSESEAMLKGLKKKQSVFQKLKSKMDNKNPLKPVDHYDFYITKFYNQKNLLSIFHSLLIKEIKQKPRKDVSSKQTLIDIIFDDKKGIYRADNDKLCYGIKSGSKRSRIVYYLCRKDKVSIVELSKEIKQSVTLTIKEISEINLNFRKKLNLTYDLITRNLTGGYSLNREQFNIKT